RARMRSSAASQAVVIARARSTPSTQATWQTATASEPTWAATSSSQSQVAASSETRLRSALASPIRLPQAVCNARSRGYSQSWSMTRSWNADGSTGSLLLSLGYAAGDGHDLEPVRGTPEGVARAGGLERVLPRPLARRERAGVGLELGEEH